MDIEKLIEQLKYYGTTYAIGDNLGKEIDGSDELMLDAATALSTLQTENKKLRAELEQVREKNAGLALALLTECAPNPDCLGDNEWRAIRAELEQVKAERDAAVSWAQKYTESIDMPCVACKHNTGDYVCTAICGNCGPMGAESCKWEFDFSGELKED